MEREVALDLVFPILVLASASALLFQVNRSGSENAIGSVSMRCAQFWHSQIPFRAFLLCSGVKFGLYRGPFADAAVMCAATPILETLEASHRGPLVKALHSGLEQSMATL